MEKLRPYVGGTFMGNKVSCWYAPGPVIHVDLAVLLAPFEAQEQSCFPAHIAQPVVPPHEMQRRCPPVEGSTPPRLQCSADSWCALFVMH
jgi:hypothetical protein